MTEPSRAALHAASQVEAIVDAAERAAVEARRQAEKDARDIVAQAKQAARKDLDDSRRKALQLGEDARKEAARTIAEAREAADAVLAEAQSLGQSLKAAANALTAEAERLVRDVQLTHRELLAELRLPGVAEVRAKRQGRSDPADETGRVPGEPPRRRPTSPEVFDLPDWVPGDH